MMLRTALFALPLALLLSNCQSNPQNKAGQPERLVNYTFPAIRLGDGVPLDLKLTIRWQVSDPEAFSRFNMPADSFQKYVLYPRSVEALQNMAHDFPFVDSVFFGQRTRFLQEIRAALAGAVQTDGVALKEVVITNVSFPTTYVTAIEQGGLQRQEMERIRRETAIAIAQSDADRRKTEAASRVQIAQEEANARIRDIQARDEDKRRASEVAKAETEVQIEAKRALIAAERQRQLNMVDLEKVSRMNELEISKQRQVDSTDYRRQVDLARVFGDNPMYANFVVNKELAGKVNIAVVPNNVGQGILDNVLPQTTRQKQ